MGANSTIEWCDVTFNPWTWCTKCSPGCATKTSDHYWKQPIAWNKKCRLTGIRVSVFTGSLCDVFDEEVPDIWRDKWIELVNKTPFLSWLILTKRPRKAREYFASRDKRFGREGRGNMMLGVTVCDQREAEDNIPVIASIPAPGHFVSVEPMLGPVDISRYMIHPKRVRHVDALEVDWVICGGETGPNARPLHIHWVRSLRDQCEDAEVPFFFKQWGEYGPTARNLMTGEPCFQMFVMFQHWKNKARTRYDKNSVFMDAAGRTFRNGGDFQNAVYPVVVVKRVGKSVAGCKLDGREYKQFPNSLRRCQ